MARDQLLELPANTICHFLWDTAYIDHSGDVFSCCRNRPGRLGNIYNEDLKAIWHNSHALQRFRQQSRRRRLSCFPRCNLLSMEEKANGVIPSPACHPRRIWLMYGERCNLNCVMCPQDHRSRTHLDNDVLRKNIDWSQVEHVEMQGGEVLASKDAREFYLWLTKARNKKVNVITNGTLITDAWARHLVQGANWLQISVNAATAETHERVNRGSDFRRVSDNIKKLVALKRALRAGVMIVYKFTITPINISEVVAAVPVADGLGCDRITYGYDLTVPAYLKNHQDIRTKLREGLNSVIETDRWHLKIGVSRLKHLGLYDESMLTEAQGSTCVYDDSASVELVG